MHTDPIADMLVRLKNAIKAGHITVSIPYSKEKQAVLNILKSGHFIKDVVVKENKKTIDKELSIELIKGRSLDLKRISKPGKRMYIKHKNIKKVLNGLGILVLSTPKGILSNDQAKKDHVGGEIICEVS